MSQGEFALEGSTEKIQVKVDNSSRLSIYFGDSENLLTNYISKIRFALEMETFFLQGLIQFSKYTEFFHLQCEFQFSENCKKRICNQIFTCFPI